MKNTQRKLSFKRLALALITLGIISYGTFSGWNNWQDNISTATFEPWFAPYVDVTATPKYPFEQLGDKSAKTAVLAFIVSHREDKCAPSWGGVYTLDEAGRDLDLDRRIARFRQLGGNIVISFGGALNDELAAGCWNEEELLKAYELVIDRYKVDTLDLDIEGAGLSDNEALIRRALVLSKLQKSRRSEGKNLAIWLTLPVSPQGLTEAGTDAVSTMLTYGVDLAGVNVMAMDYGESRDKNTSMQYASERALIETHRQLGILYAQANVTLNAASLWAKIGATPMIGQNDIAGEIFGLGDATGFNEFALSKGIARMSMWSANRDIECGENYVNVTVVSDSCSGVKQEKYGFAKVLSQGFRGNIISNALFVTTESAETTQKPDNPEESPYQIWSETATYLEGTKVVWHQNVYQAKWWNKDELPDNPVLQAWETPWQLIGPVLPGEKPVVQLTLPEGTYPVWAGDIIFQAGERVLFDGIAYQAKWWTQGDSPAASSSNPDSSPWVPLTREEVERIIEENNS